MRNLGDVDETECRGIGGIRAMEPGSLCGRTRPIGGPGDGRGLNVNPMEWYCLKARVASMMFMV